MKPVPLPNKIKNNINVLLFESPRLDPVRQHLILRGYRRCVSADAGTK